MQWCYRLPRASCRLVRSPKSSSEYGGLCGRKDAASSHSPFSPTGARRELVDGHRLSWGSAKALWRAGLSSSALLVPLHHLVLSLLARLAHDSSLPPIGPDWQERAENEVDRYCCIHLSHSYHAAKRHCHVGDIYLSTARSGHPPQTGKSMAWRAPTWFGPLQNPLFLANVTMPLKVMSAIESCRTSALGGHVERRRPCESENGTADGRGPRIGAVSAWCRSQASVAPTSRGACLTAHSVASSAGTSESRAGSRLCGTPANRRR